MAHIKRHYPFWIWSSLRSEYFFSVFLLAISTYIKKKRKRGVLSFFFFYFSFFFFARNVFPEFRNQNQVFSFFSTEQPSLASCCQLSMFYCPQRYQHHPWSRNKEGISKWKKNTLLFHLGATHQCKNSTFAIAVLLFYSNMLYYSDMLGYHSCSVIINSRGSDIKSNT